MFYNLANFVKCKENCFFCDTKLECRLTNFIGSDTGGVPLINAPLKNDAFIFNVSRTTPSYTVKAEGIIDTQTDVMLFIMGPPDDTAEETPHIDDMVAKAAFLDLKPHIQLYCPYKKCPHQYTVAGDTFKLALSKDAKSYLILPFRLYYESFTEGKLWVQNDYIHSNTYIYSRVKEEAHPLIFPLMNFEDMGKKKVLTRVKTLVVFS